MTKFKNPEIKNNEILNKILQKRSRDVPTDEAFSKDRGVSSDQNSDCWINLWFHLRTNGIRLLRKILK